MLTISSKKFPVKVKFIDNYNDRGEYIGRKPVFYSFMQLDTKKKDDKKEYETIQVYFRSVENCSEWAPHTNFKEEDYIYFIEVLGDGSSFLNRVKYTNKQGEEKTKTVVVIGSYIYLNSLYSGKKAN